MGLRSFGTRTTGARTGRPVDPPSNAGEQGQAPSAHVVEVGERHVGVLVEGRLHPVLLRLGKADPVRAGGKSLPSRRLTVRAEVPDHRRPGQPIHDDVRVLEAADHKPGLSRVPQQEVAADRPLRHVSQQVMSRVEDPVRLQATVLSFRLRLDEGGAPLAQDARAMGRAGVQGGESGRVVVSHARRVRRAVPLLEGHPHGAHLGGRDGVAVHLGEEVVPGLPGLVAPAVSLERPGVRWAVHLLDLSVEQVRSLVVDRVRVRWEEVAVAAVLVLVDEQLRRVLPQQSKPP